MCKAMGSNFVLEGNNMDQNQGKVSNAMFRKRKWDSHNFFHLHINLVSRRQLRTNLKVFVLNPPT